MVRLSLFGSYHFNRLGVVQSDLEKFGADADALAVEFPLGEGGWRDLLRSILQFPALFLGGQLLFVVLQGPAFALFNRELRSTEFCAAEAVADGRPVHTVDKSPLTLLRDRHAGWVVGNWVVLVALAVYDPVSLAIAAVLGVAVVGVVAVQFRAGRPRLAALLTLLLACVAWWALHSGPFSVVTLLGLYAPFVVAMKATLTARNEVMCDQIEQLAADNGYDHVCLATGRAHVPGITDILSERDLSLGEVFHQRWLRSGRRSEAPTVTDEDGQSTTDPTGGARMVLRRGAAVVVDWAVILVLGVAMAVWVAVMLAFAGAGTEEVLLRVGPLALDAANIVVLLWIGAAALYYMTLESRDGQTLGKRLLGLQVVEADGTVPSQTATAVRTLLRPVDFLPLGYIMGVVFAALTDRNRRLGDLAAGTMVVRTSLKQAMADEEPEGHRRPDSTTPTD